MTNNVVVLSYLYVVYIYLHDDTAHDKQRGCFVITRYIYLHDKPAHDIQRGCLSYLDIIIF